jgi:hypothetical protein
MSNKREIAPAMIAEIRAPLFAARHVDFQMPADGCALPAPFESAIDDSEA